MFTIEQIKEAHSKVQSGADFPKYVQDLIQLGIIRYQTFVHDGHTDYQGNNNYTTSSDAKYTSMEVSDKSNEEEFKRILKLHQQGGTDYLTFCKQAADSGIEKWVVDTNAMTCTYYDKAGNTMLIEIIPLP